MVLTLSNPSQRNALGPEMYAAGIEALNGAENSSEVRSVVLVGEGPWFCAGGSLQRLSANREREPAVQLGLGYPRGPLAMGNLYGPTNMLEVLFNLQTVYGDPRYRPSPWLRRRGALGLSLLHEEE